MRIFGNRCILPAGRMNVYAPGIIRFIVLNAMLLTLAYSLMWVKSEQTKLKGLFSRCPLMR